MAAQVVLTVSIGSSSLFTMLEPEESPASAIPLPQPPPIVLLVTADPGASVREIPGPEPPWTALVVTVVRGEPSTRTAEPRWLCTVLRLSVTSLLPLIRSSVVPGEREEKWSASRPTRLEPVTARAVPPDPKFRFSILTSCTPSSVNAVSVMKVVVAPGRPVPAKVIGASAVPEWVRWTASR